MCRIREEKLVEQCSRRSVCVVELVIPSSSLSLQGHACFRIHLSYIYTLLKCLGWRFEVVVPLVSLMKASVSPEGHVWHCRWIHIVRRTHVTKSRSHIRTWSRINRMLHLGLSSTNPSIRRGLDLCWSATYKGTISSINIAYYLVQNTSLRVRCLLPKLLSDFEEHYLL